MYFEWRSQSDFGVSIIVTTVFDGGRRPKRIEMLVWTGSETRLKVEESPGIVA